MNVHSALKLLSVLGFRGPSLYVQRKHTSQETELKKEVLDVSLVIFCL